VPELVALSARFFQALKVGIRAMAVRIALSAAIITIFFCLPAQAQSDATAATPGVALETTLPPADPAAAPGSALDEPIEQIADSPGGCAVLDTDFPGLRDHPMYPFFKSLTLNQIAAMSGGKITPDMLAQAKADLAAAPAAPAATPVAAAAAAP
jgi:hypothetical protein